MKSEKAFFFLVILFLEIKKKERPFLEKHGNAEEGGHLWEGVEMGTKDWRNPCAFSLEDTQRSKGSLPPKC